MEQGISIKFNTEEANNVALCVCKILLKTMKVCHFSQMFTGHFCSDKVTITETKLSMYNSGSRSVAL